MKLEGILKFVGLTHGFQQIERALYATGENRKENDAEHSYQLALVAWYMVGVLKLDLDIEKVIKYSLLHDLVEVYAGDTQAFGDKAAHLTKVDREKEALKRLKVEYPEFPELFDLITQYEHREDEESQFVYALDKILPPLNIYLDKGRSWQEAHVTLDQIIEYKTAKVASHPVVKKYFDMIIEVLQNEQQTLFNK